MRLSNRVGMIFKDVSALLIAGHRYTTPFTLFPLILCQRAGFTLAIRNNTTFNDTIPVRSPLRRPIR